MEHCLIFSRNIFYVTADLCLNILWLKAVNEITARSNSSQGGAQWGGAPGAVATIVAWKSAPVWTTASVSDGRLLKRQRASCSVEWRLVKSVPRAGRTTAGSIGDGSGRTRQGLKNSEISKHVHV